MSKSILKLIDYSLFPAMLLVLGKVVGTFLVASFLELELSLNNYQESLQTLTSEELQAVASYSDMFMYAVIATFLTFTIVRAVFLHDTHVKPTLSVRLANNNLLNLISSSYEIYHSSAVSLMFGWIATLLILINVLNGYTFFWVLGVSFVSSIILTAILLQDIYREIENIKHKPGRYEWI